MNSKISRQHGDRHIKIRVEANSLATNKMSGVGYYTRLLCEAIARQSDVELSAFSFNFLGRQPIPKLSSHINQEQNLLFPLRVYAKLQSFKISPPFDMFLKGVDLTIFPNYSKWPTINSGLKATVIHDLTYVHYPELVESKNLSHLKRVVGSAILSSDFIITVSESVKKELCDNFSLSPERIVVTTIPPDQVFYKRSANEVHKKYGIPTRDYIFFISTIEPRKNLAVLIEAYSKLQPELQKKYSLVIAGGKGWKSEASMKSIENAVESGLNVVHIGYIDELDRPALYQRAALHVLPSIYEGFGMSILEAAASKTAVVATDIPVLREVGGDGAEYFASNDSESLAGSISKVLTDDSYRKLLVKKASSHLSSFSWDKNAKLIIDRVNATKEKR